MSSFTASATDAILTVGKSKIHIDAAAGRSVTDSDLLDWVQRATSAVTNYLGRFPVRDLSLEIARGGRGAVNDGVTHGGTRITIRLGRRAKAGDLRNDWMLTHEMFHLAFPTLDDRYKWAMEGLSDYLEPISRARAGQLTPEEVWRGFVEGLPQGLPGPNDKGLDGSENWGRIYWGGNLFWLLADIRIREKTGGRRTLEDAIRAILDAGGNGDANWSIERVIKVGDHATKTSVLEELHEEFGLKPGAVDLDTLWKKLGVKYNAGAVTFDDTAPDADIRRALTRSPR